MASGASACAGSPSSCKVALVIGPMEQRKADAGGFTPAAAHRASRLRTLDELVKHMASTAGCGAVKSSRSASTEP